MGWLPKKSSVKATSHSNGVKEIWVTKVSQYQSKGSYKENTSESWNLTPTQQIVLQQQLMKIGIHFNTPTWPNLPTPKIIIFNLLKGNPTTTTLEWMAKQLPIQLLNGI